MSTTGKHKRTLLDVLGGIVAIVVTAVLSLHGIVHYQQRHNSIVENMQLRAAESIERLATTVAPFMEAYAINEYVKLVASETRLMRHLAVVVDDRRMGRITGLGSHFSGLVLGRDSVYAEFNELDPAHQKILKEAYFRDSADIHSAAGEPIGSITVYLSDDAVRQAQQQALLSTLVIGVVTALLLITLLLIAARRLLVNPLQEIARTLAMRDADGIPTTTLRDHEIEEMDLLTRTMNDMVRTIRESRDALSDERTRLEYVISGTNAGTWEWNVVTGETQFNQRWAEILGYTLDELQPVSIETWARLTHPTDLEQSSIALEQHFAGLRPYYECEARMRHKHGHWVWVLDRGRVARWSDDGKPHWMYGTHLDITERKQQDLRLAASESRFRSFFEKNSSVMLLVEPGSGVIEDANRAAVAYYGYSQDQLVGMRVAEINTLDEEQLAKVRQRALDEESDQFVFQHRLASGEVRDVEVHSTPIRVEERQLLFSIVQDITDRVRAEARLQLAASVFTHAREGIIITDANALIVDVNEAFERITGYRKQEVLGRNPRILSSGRQEPQFYASMWRNLLRAGHWYGELWNRHKDGSLFAVLQTISAVRDANDVVHHYVALFSDITRLKENQRELEHIAHYDALTGLPNRLLLGDRLRQAILQDERREQVVAVVFLDLDGFKAVNDRHGHEIGDHLLVTISGRMRQVLRESDTLSRIGGDEFVAVLGDLATQQDCLPLLQRLLDVASSPVHVGGEQLAVTASLGVAFYPQSEDVDADQLLRQADQAMYQAKLSGKNRYHVFDADQDRSLRGRHERLERIQQALSDGEFELFYQPKVNMRSGALVGVEALIRWHHPERGLVPPGLFLPVIEGHEMMIELGEWTLRSALTQLAAWRAAGLQTQVSVNIAASHLQRADFVDRLHDILDAHPEVAPTQLELEILETSALENIDHVSHVIERCQDIGVTFALDDFGTGYSSLTYLKRLPAEVLKIDRSFVRDMHDDPEDLTILEGVISLAGAFQREVIAEGVESDEHGELLLWLGCELAQGYGIARPMPGSELQQWHAGWRPPVRWTRASPIERSKLPVLFAMVQHRAWIAALEAYLADGLSEPPALDPHECRLGRWLHSSKLDIEAHDMAELHRLHLRVHEAANDLMHFDPKRQSVEFVHAKARVLELRDSLLEALERLITA